LRLGFRLRATAGTAAALQRAGLPVTVAAKVGEGGHHIAAMVAAGEIDLIINTPLGQRAHDDSTAMRAAAIRHRVPLLTTLSAAQAAVGGIRALQEKELRVRSLQVHHASGR
jgi:carbamoyl-phosphate synthase large subunit